MTARFSWDDATTWHADPTAAEDELAEEGPVYMYCAARHLRTVALSRPR